MTRDNELVAAAIRAIDLVIASKMGIYATFL
jgi:hypothetical protein